MSYLSIYLSIYPAYIFHKSVKIGTDFKGQFDVFEHSFELRSELESALLLEFCEEGSFAVLEICGFAAQKSNGEVALVVFFENVLVLQ